MNVLIIDDHPLYRDGLKTLLLGLDPQMSMTEVGTVDAAMAHPGPFDIVLLDMTLPGISELQALERVRGMYESTPIVVVSATEDPDLVSKAIAAGAAGYIPKTTDQTVTVHALRLVLANGTYLPQLVLDATRRHSRPAPSFSPRQLAILRCLLQGKANKVIARELSIAEGTVKAHLWSIYQLLGVESRHQAVYRAHELGIFDSPEPAR
jgi:DNA-binding NarL/FixJ family response regulator